jgi:hypothetical protein
MLWLWNLRRLIFIILLAFCLQFKGGLWVTIHVTFTHIFLNYIMYIFYFIWIKTIWLHILVLRFRFFAVVEPVEEFLIMDLRERYLRIIFWIVNYYFIYTVRWVLIVLSYFFDLVIFEPGQSFGIRLNLMTGKDTFLRLALLHLVAFNIILSVLKWCHAQFLFQYFFMFIYYVLSVLVILVIFYLWHFWWLTIFFTQFQWAWHFILNLYLKLFLLIILKWIEGLYFLINFLFL